MQKRKYIDDDENDSQVSGKKVKLDAREETALNDSNQPHTMTHCGIIPYLYREEEVPEVHLFADMQITVKDKNIDEQEMFLSEVIDDYYNNDENKDNGIQWKVLLEKWKSKELEDVTDLLYHGDIVFTMEYRMCGVYVVYKPFPEDEIILIPTLLEYGYALPFEFSDAPVNYYEDSGLMSQYVASDCMWPGTEMYSVIGLCLEESCCSYNDLPMYGLYMDSTVEQWNNEADEQMVSSGTLEAARSKFKILDTRVRKVAFEFALPLFIRLLPVELIRIIITY
jgi:hypothetical protein